MDEKVTKPTKAKKPTPQPPRNIQQSFMSRFFGLNSRNERRAKLKELKEERSLSKIKRELDDEQKAAHALAMPARRSEVINFFSREIAPLYQALRAVQIESAAIRNLLLKKNVFDEKEWLQEITDTVKKMNDDINEQQAAMADKKAAQEKSSLKSVPQPEAKKQPVQIDEKFKKHPLEV